MNYHRFWKLTSCGGINFCQKHSRAPSASGPSAHVQIAGPVSPPQIKHLSVHPRDHYALHYIATIHKIYHNKDCTGL